MAGRSGLEVQNRRGFGRLSFRIDGFMNSLIKTLKEIRTGIERKSYPNEAAVRNQIFMRVLQDLGWEVFDPKRVVNEFNLRFKGSTRRVDLALCVEDGKPRCIVELKATSHNLDRMDSSASDLQLFEYAFHAGAPLALLTNGVIWRFYCPSASGTYEDRLVAKLDMRNDGLQDFSERVDRYLSFRNTESAEAEKNARLDL